MVVNENLMDNHQIELASAMAKGVLNSSIIYTHVTRHTYAISFHAAASVASDCCYQGYLYWTRVSNVLEVLENSDFKKLLPYPRPDPTKFADFIDKELGFDRCR